MHQNLLPEGVLKEIVNLAALAPSAFNLQPWRIVAATTPEGKAKLHEAAFKQPKIVDAPVTLIIIGDREGYGPQNDVWDSEGRHGGRVREQFHGNGSGTVWFHPGTSDQVCGKQCRASGNVHHVLGKGIRVDSHPMSGMDFQAVKDAFQLKDSEGSGHADQPGIPG